MINQELRKLKVGDKVRIVSKRPNTCLWWDEMNKYLGKVMTVREVGPIGFIPYVKFLEDNGERDDGKGWTWTHEMIECKVIDTESQPTIVEHLVKGNKVIVKLSNGKVGVADCSPEDEFDICEGLKLAIDRAYGRVPGFKKSDKKDEQRIKKVKRHAKRGEYIKIVKPYCSMDLYSKGSILQVEYGNGYLGGKDCIQCKFTHGLYSIKDTEYVVLENYKPNKKNN